MAAISWRSRIEADDALVREGPVAVEGLRTRHVVTLLFGPDRWGAQLLRASTGWLVSGSRWGAVARQLQATGWLAGCWLVGWLVSGCSQGCRG